MEYQDMLFEVRDRVAYIALNRPQALNSFSMSLGLVWTLSARPIPQTQSKELRSFPWFLPLHGCRGPAAFPSALLVPFRTTL